METARAEENPDSRHAQAILPIELWETIIDAVAAESMYYAAGAYGRTYTLRSCALTCRIWTFRSLYHLNTVVTFSEESSIKRFLFRFPPPDVPVQTLSIKLPPTVSLRDSSSWVSSNLIRLKSFPKLRELAIQNFNFEYAHAQLIPRLSISLPLSRTLRNLILFDVIFTSANQLNRLLRSFRQLPSIRLMDIRFPENASPLILPVVTPHITSKPPKDNSKTGILCIYSADYRGGTPTLPSILTIFIHMLSTTLTWLEMDEFWLSNECIPVANNFFKSCKTLEYIQITLWLNNNNGRICHLGCFDALDLSENKQLKIIDVGASWHEDLLTPYILPLSRFIGTIKSPRFYSLRLRLGFSGIEKLGDVPWNALDDVLCTDNLSGLTDVSIVVGHPNSGMNQIRDNEYITQEEFLPHVMSVTESNMPACYRKQLLRFRYHVAQWSKI
ncbi:hypothetical protein ABKN59_010521 [Abortiporus biennis]